MTGLHSSAAGAPVATPAPAALYLDLEPLGTVDTAPVGPGTVVLARFRVYGTPKPQGSKVPFLDRNSGQARLKEQNEGSHRSWRNDVAAAAAQVVDELALTAPLDGALALEVTFRFPMVRSRPKAQRRAGTVLKTTAPDTSKLVRSIEDSMEAARLICNDARFAVVLATKVEVADSWTGADIVIRRAA